MEWGLTVVYSVIDSQRLKLIMGTVYFHTVHYNGSSSSLEEVISIFNFI